MDTSKQIIKLINHKIRYRRSDTLFNHLKTYFKFDQLNFSGECYDTYFSIWRYSVWSGLFYSVIIGQIHIESDKTIVTLKTKLNSAGLLFSVLVFVAFFFGFSNFQLDTITIKIVFIRLIFASLPLIAIGICYLFQRQKAVDDINKMLKNYPNILLCKKQAYKLSNKNV